MQKNKINLVSFFIVLIGISLAFTRMVYPFILNAVMAAVLAILFDPLYKKLLHRFPNRKYTMSLITTVVVLFIVIIPLSFTGYSLATQSPIFISWTLNKIQLLQSNFMDYPFFIKLQSIPEFENMLKGLSNFGNQITNFMLITTQNTFMSASRFIVDFIFIIIFLFFFLADGRALVDKIKSVLPIGKTLEAHLFSRLETVIDATIRGNLIVALIEGTFGGILVFIYGFPSPLLLACLMAILSFIPLVGINFIVIPLGLARILSGQILSGLSMIIISLAIISISQNVIKPKLVGDRSGLHPLLVLIATIGGLSWFGLVGFVIGPIIAVLFLTSWELFSHEFIRHQTNNPLG